MVSYPPGVSPFAIEDVMHVLQTESLDSLPVVISHNKYTQQLNIGERITMELADKTYPLEITGIIVDFPLLSGAYAITNLSHFSQLLTLESIDPKELGSWETWIATLPDEHARVLDFINEAGMEEDIIGNSQIKLKQFENNLVYREVTTAFELNAMILLPLSLVGFFMIQSFTARRRADEFNVLQAIGLSRTQIRRLLIFEGFSFIALGLLLGTAIGLALAILMQPFLAELLPEIKTGFAITKIQINWVEVGLRFLALSLLYGISLFVYLLGTIRNLEPAQL
jgi:ABC-type lipoprotein release transport system permease subunit